MIWRHGADNRPGREAVTAERTISAEHSRAHSLPAGWSSAPRRRITAEATSRFSERATAQEAAMLNRLRDQNAEIAAAIAKRVEEWALVRRYSRRETTTAESSDDWPSRDCDEQPKRQRGCKAAPAPG
jgi:hypothetical protein